ncbi:MAG: hypothetical protein COA73_01115 [Candidatus Hydrogenedentota bacterium]|nr:MAG: hypothetical protein COA73_01115 [Candidatus Hydrogenedentota bacterium]
MDTHTEILSKSFEGDLKRLCILFEGELARQEKVYSICCAQGRAARVNDVDALDAHTRELVALMEEVFESEQERLPVLQHIVSYYQLSEENHTLSELIAVVPNLWQRRLQAFQKNIKNVLAKTQLEVRGNQSYMLQASKRMEETIATSLQQDEQPAEGYAHDGTEAVKPGQRPAVLNALG